MLLSTGPRCVPGTAFRPHHGLLLGRLVSGAVICHMFSFPLHARPLLTHFSKELRRSRWDSSSRPRLLLAKYVPSASLPGSWSQEQLQPAAQGPSSTEDSLAPEKQHTGFTSCVLKISSASEVLRKILYVTTFSSYVNRDLILYAGIIFSPEVLSEAQCPQKRSRLRSPFIQK